LKAKLQEISSIMESSSVDVYNAYVTCITASRAVGLAVDKYNYDVDLANSKTTQELTILKISGGIGLEPENSKCVNQHFALLEQTRRVAGMKEASTVFKVKNGCDPNEWFACAKQKFH